jgi:hypothetical protein
VADGRNRSRSQIDRGPGGAHSQVAGRAGRHSGVDVQRRLGHVRKISDGGGGGGGGQPRQVGVARVGQGRALVVEESRGTVVSGPGSGEGRVTCRPRLPCTRVVYAE